MRLAVGLESLDALSRATKAIARSSHSPYAIGWPSHCTKHCNSATCSSALWQGPFAQSGDGEKCALRCPMPLATWRDNGVVGARGGGLGEGSQHCTYCLTLFTWRVFDVSCKCPGAPGPQAGVQGDGGGGCIENASRPAHLH